MGLRDKILEALTGAGFSAQPARPWAVPRPVETNLILVGVSRMEALQGAHYRYLGLDEDGEERYGMALTGEVNLSLLSPKELGGEEGETFAGNVTAALLAGINGLPVEKISWGETRYDAYRDCFLTVMTLKVRVLALAAKQDEEFRLERLELRPSYA